MSQLDKKEALKQLIQQYVNKINQLKAEILKAQGVLEFLQNALKNEDKPTIGPNSTEEVEKV